MVFVYNFSLFAVHAKTDLVKPFLELIIVVSK